MLKYAESILKKDSKPEQVCAYFFRVTARPAIFIVSDIAKYAFRQFTPLYDELNTMDNWARSADRSLITADDADVLFTESEVENEFKADSVIMKITSNLESVVENTSGKIIALLSQNQRPIPFDASFP